MANNVGSSSGVIPSDNINYLTTTNQVEKLESSENTTKLKEKKSMKEKVKEVGNRILGYIKEFFAFLAMAILYLVPYTKFDPKADDLAQDQQPIILVHGYLHNSSAWIPFRHRLNKAGLQNVFTIDLGAFPNKSIDEYADVLKKKVKEVCELTGRNDISLVGHSMGGLVCEHYARNKATTTGTNGVTVSKIVTLATPRQGTKMGIFGVGPCVRDMMPESKFIQELDKKAAEQSENESQSNIKIFRVAAKSDIVVLPYKSALNRAKEKEDTNIQRYTSPSDGHCSILFSSIIAEKTAKFLK